MRGPRLLILCAVALAATAWAQDTSNPELERAAGLFSSGQSSKAAEALELAWKRPGNDRPTVLRILELQALTALKLNQTSTARATFQTLLVLAPGHTLPGQQPPKVASVFAEAVASAKQLPPLELRPASPAISEGKVQLVAAEVPHDSEKLARKVRFHFKEAAGWRQEEAELYGKTAAAGADAAQVQWWAELLGEYDRVLVTAGSAEAPIVDGTPLEAVVVTAKPPQKLIPPAQPVQVERTWKGIPLRKAAYGAAAASGVALLLGSYFGLQSNGARAQLEGAQTDPSGRVVGLTQRRAYELDAQARGSATAANLLWVSGLALAAAGGGLWHLSGQVVASPAPGGVAIAGAF